MSAYLIGSPAHSFIAVCVLVAVGILFLFEAFLLVRKELFGRCYQSSQVYTLLELLDFAIHDMNLGKEWKLPYS